MIIEKASRISAELGESPIWDARRGCIWWVDILKKRLICFEVESGGEQFFQFDELLGFVALSTKGKLVLGFENGITIYDPEAEKTLAYLSLEKELRGQRINDGKCDPAGRIWFGSMPLSEDGRPGNIYLLDHDFSCRRMIQNMKIPNGMAWNNSGDLLYYIETSTRTLSCYDLRSGKPVLIRTFDFSVNPKGKPDGMTIDTDGNLHVAFWDSGSICKWNIQNNSFTASIKLPVLRPTSCCFGDKDLDTLFVTTASLNQQHPDAGKLFTVRNTGVRGVKPHIYAYHLST